MKKPSEKSKALLSLVRRWQKLEDSTIKSAEGMLGKTANPLIKTTMEMIKRDSEKHKIALQGIIDAATKQAPALSPDELASLSGMLNKHMEIEANSMKLAAEAHANSELFYTSYLLSALLEDEARHHRMITQLMDELKKASIATSTGVRRPKK